MSVLQLKPHKLSFLISSQGYEDENGDYHTGNDVWSDYEIDCGVVSSGKSTEIKFEDGKVDYYSYTITLPRHCREFHRGERIRISFSGGTQKELVVKGFFRYQLQSKIWA